MTKQKKKKTTKKKGKKQRVISSTEKVVISLVVFMISLLVLISLLTKPQTLNSDHQIVNKTGILGNKVQTNVVESTKPQNPVGRLGAVTGYGLSSILGQKYSIILCLSVMFLLLVGILKKNKLRDAVLLILKINIFTLLFQTLLNVNSTNLSPSSGLISHNIIGILTQLLQKVGTIIVLVSINLLLLAWVIGFEYIGGLFPKGSSSIPKKTIKPKKKRSIDLSTADVESFEDDNIEDDWREKPEININTHDDYPLPKARKTTPKKQVIDDTHNEDNFEIEEYVLPDIDELLTSPPRSSKKTKTASAEEIKRISSILQDKLAEFDIEADVLNVNVGPIITQYELKPAPGVKVNKFTALTDDLALALKAKSLRIQAPIPGRGLIGIELPNPERDIIYLKDLLLSDEMMTNKFLLPIALGKDISGRPVVGDLSKMPHLLVAGATGSGKSVCINTIITSLIVRKRPDELRMILIDPKRVELAPYAAIPHLIGEVVTDPDNALQNLQWAEVEMERRYGCLQDLKVRDIASYNDKVAKLKAKAIEAGEEQTHYFLPFIVIVVDEFADLIMTAGRDVELPITRLAQKARAVGIHLILATQRPSRKVITGLIKANFPSRIAFQVSSRIESSIILDSIGAEKLLGRGDMLYLPAGTAYAERVHGCFVSDQEVEELCDYLGSQPKPVEIKVKRDVEENEISISYDDELFPQAARLVVENNMASVSMLQRHFKVGYARAGRLIDMLERAGIVGPHLGSKSRDVVASEEDLERYGI